MDSFGRHDLLVLAKLAEQAHSFIVERQHAAAAHESGDTGSVACVITMPRMPEFGLETGPRERLVCLVRCADQAEYDMT